MVFRDLPIFRAGGAAGGAAPPGAVLGAARHAAAAAVDAQLEDAAQLSEPRGRWISGKILGNSWETMRLFCGKCLLGGSSHESFLWVSSP